MHFDSFWYWMKSFGDIDSFLSVLVAGVGFYFIWRQVRLIKMQTEAQTDVLSQIKEQTAISSVALQEAAKQNRLLKRQLAISNDSFVESIRPWPDIVLGNLKGNTTYSDYMTNEHGSISVPIIIYNKGKGTMEVDGIYYRIMNGRDLSSLGKIPYDLFDSFQWVEAPQRYIHESDSCYTKNSHPSLSFSKKDYIVNAADFTDPIERLISMTSIAITISFVVIYKDSVKNPFIYQCQYVVPKYIASKSDTLETRFFKGTANIQIG